MQRLIEWLPQHMPAETGERASVVHGDYRLDNLIFHPTNRACSRCSTGSCPRSAIRSPTSPITAWRGMSIRRNSAALRVSIGPRSAFPTKRRYVERYCERTGFEIHGDWNFYLAYNMFRIAAILQGIMKRVVDGTAASAQALDAGRRAKPMAELAWQLRAESALTALILLNALSRACARLALRAKQRTRSNSSAVRYPRGPR